MKTQFSHSQQQLLTVLGISPLQLVDAFTVNNTDCVEPTNLMTPDLSAPLAADITFALGGRCEWLIAPASEQAVLDHSRLITPDLTRLTTTARKRALWQLIQTLPAEPTAELE